MPQINLGGQWGNWGKVASDLVQEDQGQQRINLAVGQQAIQQNQFREEMAQRRSEFDVNTYLKARGLDVEEKSLGLRQDQLAHEMFKDTINTILRQQKQESAASQWESEFGLNQSVKEATQGIKYDPTTNKYVRLKPGEGLYMGPGGKPDYQMARFLRDDYRNITGQINENQKRIEIITAQMGDVLKIQPNSPEYKMLRMDRENRLKAVNGLEQQKKYLEAQWREYMGYDIPAEPFKASAVPTPVSAPGVVPSGLPTGPFPPFEKGVSTRPVSAPPTSSPVANTVLGVLKQNAAIKSVGPSRNLGNYSIQDLQAALAALEDNNVRLWIDRDTGTTVAQVIEQIKAKIAEKARIESEYQKSTQGSK
jgi:hypothetical protein